MKFMGLPPEVRLRMFNELNGDDMDEKVHVSYEILRLLTDANEEELTQYVNTGLGADLNGYFVCGDEGHIVSRAMWVCHYFLENICLSSGEIFIPPIE